MTMVYQWKDGAHVRGAIPAQVAGEHVESLRQRYGLVTPPVVVEDAKSDLSPLHPAFEWDDSEAAHQYRLEQARGMLRSIEVVVQLTRPDPQPIRAFVVVKEGEGQGYTSIQVAMGNPKHRAQLIADAKRELAQWRKRHGELVELGNVFAAIDKELEAA